MNKNLKITLIVLGVLVGIIALNTLQMRDLKNNEDIVWKGKLVKDNNIDKGVIMNPYNCSNSEGTVTKIHTNDKEEQLINNTEDKHSFFGKIIELHSSYIIVEPNEKEEEKKSSDKFRIELDKNNDALYEVGTNVKITYVGGIKESYPAQINTIAIENKSTDNFKIIYNIEPLSIKRKIIDKNTNKQYDYNVYIYNGKVNIVIDETTYSLEEALKENKITMDEIIAKANKDIKSPIIYKDGGSVEYHYNNYTIIKFHTLDGNRDVYIGNQNLKLSDIK